MIKDPPMPAMTPAASSLLDLAKRLAAVFQDASLAGVVTSAEVLAAGQTAGVLIRLSVRANQAPEGESS